MSEIAHFVRIVCSGLNGTSPSPRRLRPRHCRPDVRASVRRRAKAALLGGCCSQYRSLCFDLQPLSVTLSPPPRPTTALRGQIRPQEVRCRNNGPVAQSVERWTPYGGSIRPGFESPGFEARRAPDVYRASWRVWLQLVAGRSQSKSVIGTGRARLCAYVKLSTLKSAIDPELRDRKVADRANATSAA